MRLPNLLIIGAMKAGTTSLYMDLASHPQGFLAQDKEPHALASDDVLTAAGRERYASLYAKAKPEQLLIDGSTGYAKRPDYERVAERAAAILPPDFKVIYIVRHPLDRIISQHHHEHAIGLVGPDVNQEVRRHERLINYSRYDYQLSPWVEQVGLDRICVLRFEDYVRNRREVLERVCAFLGIAGANQFPEEGMVYNRSQGKPIRNSMWNFVLRTRLYRNILRPLAPVRTRLALRRVLMPKARFQLTPPRPETIEYLRERIRDDVVQLQRRLQIDEPLWPDFAPSPTIAHGA